MLGSLAAVVAAGALVASSGPAMAGGSHPKPPVKYTCTSGEIPSGSYASITVKGECSVAADAVVKVAGDVTVAKGATLDAQSVPSTIYVGRNVNAHAGSLLGLVCQPPSLTGNSAHPCVDAEGNPTEGHSTITVKGNVTATNANTVLLNGITVKGNVTLLGGGAEIPWSIKNNTIGRNLTVIGQTTEWLGVLFNNVGGNATLLHITVTEDHEDASQAVFIVRNTVQRNLICFGLGPNVSGGFVPGSVNVVGGRALGQCAALV
jgi:hypothetical protein